MDSGLAISGSLLRRPPPPRARPRRRAPPMNAVPEVLRLEPRFRLLWGGQTLSVLGDLVTPVAMAFAVLSIGSTGDLALVVAVGLAPFAVFSVVGGVWADRIGRREVMLVSDLIRCAVQAGVAALLLTGAAQVWMLVALAAVFGSAEAWFRPAMAGLIPETVCEACNDLSLRHA